MSAGGAHVSLSKEVKINVGDEVDLDLIGFGWIRGTVQYEERGYKGVMFLLDNSETMRLVHHLETLRSINYPFFLFSEVVLVCWTG